MDIAGLPSFCSWSGGKDSCLALYKAIQEGSSPLYLLTMCIEEGERTRSHGLAIDIIKAQSQSLNIPIVTQNSSWADYEKNFVEKLHELKRNGIEVGIFGDIDIEPNREWEEKVCRQGKIKPFLPLWGKKRVELLNEFIESGFKALVVSVNATKLGEEFTGRTLDQRLVQEFINIGIDPSGEEGEYHTVVIDGPIFSNPLALKPGANVLRSGYWFKDFSLIPLNG